MVITNGMPGAMPALNENLTVRERWDVVNFIRTLK
jgi:mono/diheme cytochrome c family protein